MKNSKGNVKVSMEIYSHLNEYTGKCACIESKNDYTIYKARSLSLGSNAIAVCKFTSGSIQMKMKMKMNRKSLTRRGVER